MRNIYSTSPNAIHGSGFNHFFYYYELFQKNPNFFETRSTIEDSSVDKIREFCNNNVIYQQVSSSLEKEKKVVEKIKEIVFLYNDSLICFSKNSYYRSKDEFELSILYQKQETLEEIKKFIIYKKNKDIQSINLLCSTEDGLYLNKFKVSLPQKMDLELNYGKDLVEKNDKLLNHLKTSKSGLALFSGPPGTGKSTYIKYISTKLNKKIIYLPSSAIEVIASPEFLSFIISQKNSILLLEDAEKVLMNREHNANQGVSNILNISDGLLGDCLKIFIIATFNTSRDLIDPALLRKGRLFLEHEFDKLAPEQCNLIYKKMNIDKTASCPMTLAEIYNQDENYCKVEKKVKVGF